MHLIIIGNGVAGVSAALELRKKSSCEITIISNEHGYFFSRTALMYVFMGQMSFENTEPYERTFWKENNINLLKANVNNIDFINKNLFFDNNEKISYDKLILATGSVPININLQSESLNGVYNLYFKKDLEKLMSSCKNISRAVVLGGGLTGVELCEMLISRNIKVDYFIKDSYFWSSVLPESNSMFLHNYLKKIPNLTIYENTTIKNILGDELNNVKSVLTSNDEEIKCDFVGICIGVKPNIDFIKKTELKYNKGILVNEYLETSYKDVFAAGDCAELTKVDVGRKNIEALWHIAKKMGETVASNIIEKQKKYSQGIWRNSAKFFELEFHNVGIVKRELDKHESEFIWKKNDKLVHLIFDKNNYNFLAINVFGMRIRLNIFENWIINNKNIDEVINNINSGFYNMEFTKDYSKEIKQLYFEKYFNANK